MKKPKDINIRKNSFYSFIITSSTLILMLSFVFYSTKGIMRNLFYNQVVNELAGLDLALKNDTGEINPSPTYQLEFLEKDQDKIKEIVEHRYNNISAIFNFLPFLLIITLFLVKGWSNIKMNVIKMKSQFINKFIAPSFSREKITWFVGRKTYSYGFTKKKIVLGSDYLLKDKNNKDFIIYHEIRHLQFRDSIIKNFILNLRKVFLPFFLLYYWFTTVQATFTPILFPWIKSELDNPNLNATQQLVLLTSFILVTGITFLIWKSIKMITLWFSKSKEFLSDQYAHLKLNYYIPELSPTKSNYHPSPNQRKSFLANPKNSISFFPLFIFVILLANINMGYPLISDISFFVIVLGTLIVGGISDLFVLNIFSFSFLNLIIVFLLILVFGSWNYLMLQFHFSNNSVFHDNPTKFFNIIVNIILFFFTLLFGIGKYVVNNTKNKKP